MYVVVFSQAGKHEAIVKNVHDLLAKLAWDFSPEQLDHLFDCFKASWTTLVKSTREASGVVSAAGGGDDKYGVMAHKVLNPACELAHSDDVPVDIMDPGFERPHQDPGLQLLAGLSSSSHASLSVARLCASLTAGFLFGHRLAGPATPARGKRIDPLHRELRRTIMGDSSSEADQEICSLFGELLRTQVESIEADHPAFDPQTVRAGSRYSHVQEVQERLNFLRRPRGLRSTGQADLEVVLAENAVFPVRPRACFTSGTSKLMGRRAGSDPPGHNKDIFENKRAAWLDPTLLTHRERHKLLRALLHSRQLQRGQAGGQAAGVHDGRPGADRTRLPLEGLVRHTLCVLDGDKDSINLRQTRGHTHVGRSQRSQEYITTSVQSDYHEERTIQPIPVLLQ
ncbi:hypothetical protein QQF64_007480 [Cirrhinus molitorella]|uniref:UBP34/UBP24/USP9X/USP9Y-like ARM repeat region domain-containing protein n=1 Tax=Cirrhinus molitorella TaxID=172907 RepID=A0ABR3MBG3_9TELE